tara:strand:+ start:806 stop:1945 length:1140 start_codon:yes stop_codon:yes gene_type:complete
MITRRHFLSGTGAGLFLAGYPIHGFTKNAVNGRIVVILLEGGMDGLLAVPPVGDDNLYKQRKALVASNPLKLNPLFGIHPNFRNFSSMLVNEEASIVHATSFPYVGRSHFEGQNVLQGGLIAPFSIKTGWLGRAMDAAKIAGQAMSLDAPLIIRGSSDFENFYPSRIKHTRKPSSNLLELIKATHEGEIASVIEKLRKRSDGMGTRNSARDPLSLATEAGRTMREENGPRVAVIKIPQFDDHAEIGTDTGNHPELFSLVDKTFATLKNELREQWTNTVVLTMTEFGRTVKENGSAGTDHGYGSVGLLAGGLIRKSSVIANWPGLSNGDLYERRDLYATIDYRSVCAACIEAAFNLDHSLISETIFRDKKISRIYRHIFG